MNPKTGFDENMDIITWEEVANYSETKPRLKMFFEINCREKKIRSLSVHFYTDDGIAISNESLAKTDYIIPESNGETLKKILCKQGKK